MSNRSHYLGIHTDIPAYLSEGDVTVTYNDSYPHIYSISDWPADMNTEDTWVLYLPSGRENSEDFTHDAVLKYPDANFNTVYHVFYTAV